MKKSLIIRWIIILVFVLGWIYSMFPIKDQDFLAAFKAKAEKNVDKYRQQAESAQFMELKEKRAAIEDKTSKEFKEADAKLNELVDSYGNVTQDYPDVLVERYNKLMARIDNITSGKKMDGTPLEEGAPRLEGYQAVVTAMHGDGGELEGIDVAPFILPPRSSVISNRAALHLVRRSTAGKLKLGLDLQGGTEFVIALNQIGDLPANKTVADIRDQVLEILRNRLNMTGVVEPEIKALSESEISVSMPSVDDGEKDEIRRTLTDMAKLEFYLVVRDDRLNQLAASMKSDPDFKLPPDVRAFKMLEVRNGIETEETILLESAPADIDGADIDAAFPNSDQYGRWGISLKFNQKGGTAFARVTGDNVGRRLAIVLDNTVYSAPNIREAINGGSAEITGAFTYDEAKRLAGVISSGNMPAKLEISSEFGTEPSLGADSIRSGLKAGIIGLVLVVIFMIWYYKFAGVVAVIALAVNTVLVFGTMALTKATITMPGVAGMVLTIGMAVDANVLIFERIREELKRGKTLGNAITSGYARVFWCIIDSNITTLITCFFLYNFGTGSVRGFAVTLAYGILSSMFTALFMTKAIFDLMVYKKWLTTLNMRSFDFLMNTKIDFFKYMKRALVLSSVLVIVGIATAVVRHNSFLGIDFTGGILMTYSCNGESPDVENIRSYLAGNGYSEVKVGYRRGQSGKAELEITLQHLDNDKINVFNEALDKTFPDCKIEHISTYQVSGSVGSSFAWAAIKAALYAFIGIIIYLAFRFEFQYGVASVVAVIHDVVVSAGLFLLLNQGQISLTVVAALMTIIGYSLNDTIVIFDRIRELRAARKDMTYREMVNFSINDTLSRTVLTTVTTLLTCGSLLIFGGGVIFDFAIVMFYGLICGTYSTIFIATALVSRWHKKTVQDDVIVRTGAKKAV